MSDGSGRRARAGGRESGIRCTPYRAAGCAYSVHTNSAATARPAQRDGSARLKSPRGSARPSGHRSRDGSPYAWPMTPTRRWAWRRRPPTPRSRRPTAGWCAPRTPTSTPTIRAPRRGSRRSRPPTTCSRTPRRAAASTGARSTRPGRSGRSGPTTAATPGRRRTPTSRVGPGFEDIFDDPGDVFAEFLRRGRGGQAGQAGARGFNMRGPDARYHLEVPFLDAARGAKTRITMPDGASLEVNIPAGTADGQTLRLRGKGGAGYGEGGPGRRAHHRLGAAAPAVPARGRRHPHHAADHARRGGAGRQGRRRRPSTGRSA